MRVMRWLETVLALTLIVSSQSAELRSKRSSEVEKGKDSKTKKDDKDLKSAETRIPVLPYGAAYDGYDSPLAYGVEPLGAGLHSGYGHGIVGPYGYGGIIQKPLGIGGYDSGYLRSGISDGGLALGNHGGELYRGGSDGQYADGSFHEGGAYRDGGYQGLEGYKDNKHHIADDASNRGYYSGVHGSRKDLGNGEHFDKNHGYAQNGYNTLGDSALGGHKKGHHRTGFKKSYHKDESGNDESYFDSDHDEGNHQFGKQYGDEFGSNVATGIHGGHKLNEFDARHHGNDGFEGNGKLVALNQGVKDYYGKNGYYNNGNKYGSLGSGQSANFGKYGAQNGYHGGFNNGHNIDNFRTAKFGGGYGPYGGIY